MTETENATTDNIRVQVFDSSVSSLTEARASEPRREYATHNATRSQYHETKIAALNGTTVDTGIDAVALGDDATPVGNIGSSILGNETLRIGTVDLSVSGQTITASAFVDSTQGNGQTFEEAAVVAERPGGDLGINRFLLDDPGGLLDPKDQNETVTIDITITEQDA